MPSANHGADRTASVEISQRFVEDVRHEIPTVPQGIEAERDTGAA